MASREATQPPIYVISLADAQERRRRFAEHNATHIEYTFVDACDGAKLTEEDTARVAELKYWSNGAYGCAVSHKRLWRKCISLGHPIIIMEDDAIVSHAFSAHVATVRTQLPPDWDICLFSLNHNAVLVFYNSTGAKRNTFFDKHQTDRHTYESFQCQSMGVAVARLHYATGMSAYMISPRGARVLLEHCNPIREDMITIPGLMPYVISKHIDTLSATAYPAMNAFITLHPLAMTPHMSAEYKSST